MAKMTWRTLTIEADGSVDPMPSKMHGLTGDGICWFVENNAGADVTVKIKDFKKKSSGAPLNAVDFLVDNCTVTRTATRPGMIVGQIVFRPAGTPGTTVTTKYTIEVKVSGSPKVDHDPDLDVERPLD